MSRSMCVAITGMMLLLAGCGALTRADEPRAAPFQQIAEGRCPYLLSVTFFTKPITEMAPETLRVINDSPYKGVALPIIDAYDADPVPTEQQLAQALDALDESCDKHLWPWIFANRFYGQAEVEHSHNAPQHDYFKRINAVDLDDEAGALTDFYKLWRLSLRLAKKRGAPGIVVDLEGYNDYRCYKVDYVAEKRGVDVEKVVAQLRRIGREMGRIVEEEYPDAVILSLMSRLHRSEGRLPSGEPRFRTIDYMTLGLLDYLKEHQVPALVLDGGEIGGPGYYNPDVATLRKKIQRRRERMARWTKTYPDHLVLAGTIATWHDARLLGGWIKKAKDHANLQTIDDFRPFLRTLLDAYPYLWIYAAGAAKYNPYDADVASKHNKVYREVLAEFREPR